MNKKLLVGGVVAVGSIAAFVGMSAADTAIRDAYQADVVDEMESRGFNVTSTVEDVSVLGQSLSTSRFTLEKDSAVVDFHGAQFDPGGVRFESVALSERGAGELLTSGAGEFRLDEGAVSLDIADVRIDEGVLPKNPMTGAVSSADIAWSLEDVNEDASQARFDVALADFGAVQARFDFKETVRWEDDPQDIAGRLYSAALLDSLSMTYTDDGGFLEYVETVAQTQGVVPGEAQSLFAEGVATSDIDRQYAEPLVNFIDSPGSISVRVAPNDRDLAASELVEALTLASQGFLSVSQILSSLDITVESQPK